MVNIGAISLDTAHACSSLAASFAARQNQTKAVAPGGYRVLTVVSGSPAAAAKLQAFDDVIVGAGAAADSTFNTYLNATQITQEKGLAAVIGRSEEKQRDD